MGECQCFNTDSREEEMALLQISKKEAMAAENIENSGKGSFGIQFHGGSKGKVTANKWVMDICW